MVDSEAQESSEKVNNTSIKDEFNSHPILDAIGDTITDMIDKICDKIF